MVYLYSDIDSVNIAPYASKSSDHRSCGDAKSHPTLSVLSPNPNYQIAVVNLRLRQHTDEPSGFISTMLLFKL